MTSAPPASSSCQAKTVVVAVVVSFEVGRRRRRARLPEPLPKLLLEPSYCSEGLVVGQLPWVVSGWLHEWTSPLASGGNASKVRGCLNFHRADAY